MEVLDPCSLGTRVASLFGSMKGSNDMKTFESYLVLSAVMILGSLLMSGCYTQLALNEDEAAAVVDNQSPEIIQPPPIIIIIEPVAYPVPTPYYPPPAVGTSTPSTGSQPQSEAPNRNFGNQRSSSNRSDPTGSKSGTRPTGATRGGR